MLRLCGTVLALLMTLCVAAGAVGLDDFAPRVHDLNIRARADLPGFKTTLSATFGVPVPRIEQLVVALGSPADAYFCLKLGQLSGHPFERVREEYLAHRGQGWGVVAQRLGIKPGSRAFHALKDTAKIKQQHKNRHNQKKQHKNQHNKGKGKKK